MVGKINSDNNVIWEVFLSKEFLSRKLSSLFQDSINQKQSAILLDE
jgi:hypothetical protein